MHGRQLGRELGFPTANMEVADADTIESGVYESYVEIDGESAAMTVRRFMPFFGRRPCLPLCGFDSLRRESVSQCGRREPTIRQEIMYN